MSNLRIIHSNAMNRLLGITASSTTSGFIVDNLKTDRKSKVWRATGKTLETITLTWTTAETINGLAIPLCNLSSTATLRVRGYTNVADATGSPLFDSTAKIAVRYTDPNIIGLGVNTYAYGGGVCATSWFTGGVVKKLIIDIVDTANTAGYIECSKIVCGNAWQPTYNTSFGMTSYMSDSSVHDRSDSGDLVTTNGTRHKVISFDLSWMNLTDKAKFNSIMLVNGLTKSMFISLFPEDTDAEKEQTYQICGRLSSISALTHNMHTIYSGKVDIESL